MQYEDEFALFWEEVKQSFQNGHFAKLTMAKTIGKPNLRNIFVRPVYSEEDFKVLLKFRYRSRDTEDKEDELTLAEAYEVLKSHLRTSFLSVLLFTIKEDVIFKINKKGASSISRKLPSFSEVRLAEKDLE